jgi:hypothetical protein
MSSLHSIREAELHAAPVSRSDLDIWNAAQAANLVSVGSGVRNRTMPDLNARGGLTPLRRIPPLISEVQLRQFLRAQARNWPIPGRPQD